MSLLVQYTGVADVNLLAAQQFKAKSRSLAGMSAYALCEGDLKQFKLGSAEATARGPERTREDPRGAERSREDPTRGPERTRSAADRPSLARPPRSARATNRPPSC